MIEAAIDSISSGGEIPSVSMGHPSFQELIPSMSSNGWNYAGARNRVLNPMLRSTIGEALVNVSFWAPLKWIFLALCAIFAEQIKQSILIPIVKRLFRILRIPFKDK